MNGSSREAGDGESFFRPWKNAWANDALLRRSAGGDQGSGGRFFLYIGGLMVKNVLSIRDNSDEITPAREDGISKERSEMRVLFQLPLMKVVRLVILLLLCGAVTMIFSMSPDSHAARVYKWIDKDGVINISDSPPRQRQGKRGDVEIIKVPTSRSNGDTLPARPDGEYEVPFTATPQGYLVDVIFNDDVSAKLILDTGASLVIISQKLLDEIGQKPIRGASKITLLTANGEIKADPSIIKKIQLGSAMKENVHAAVTPESKVFENCDGLLGLSFLRDYNVTIDYKKGILILKEL